MSLFQRVITMIPGLHIWISLIAGQASRTVHSLVLVRIRQGESDRNRFVSDFILNKVTFLSYDI